MGQIKIDLPKEIFFSGGYTVTDQQVFLDYPDPIQIDWSQWKSVFSSKSNHKGVYVVFDGKNGDYYLPLDYTQVGIKRSCLYVGEGIFDKRLENHAKTKDFDLKATDIIYYIIENQVDRKLFERILIKHHKPLFNKEPALHASERGRIDAIGKL